jgi:two-component system response regulator FlrC
MPEQLSILVVEDDAALREAVCLTLECAGHRVVAADGGPAALERVARNSLNLVVSDLRMQPMDGIELLRRIRALEPHLPVLLMTAFGDVDKAVSAMRSGACDFLLKPFEPRVLLEHVARYAATVPASEGVIAADSRTRNLLALAARVARSDATVMLLGESGVGKEVFARYIHEQSSRAGAPFVAINCAAIPDNLLEATLFGHEKGAFTGATGAAPGKFEQAQGGTILLDEISEMPLALQAKLLRVLQQREVERVGGKQPIALDIRVVATSNRDMAQEVAKGTFREDLYYRLNVFPLHIPALRERPDDIVPLARHFAARHGGAAARIAAPAEAILAGWSWPGNVRELENTVQRALILAGTAEVGTEHVKLALQLCGDAAVVAPPQAAAAGSEAPINMKELERQHILETLKAVGGSRKRAVELLGISERTLRYKLQQYRLAGAL